MARLKLRQVVLALLVVALFAPVALAVGSPAFRPAWLSAPIAGSIPISAVLVVGLIVVLLALICVFSGSAFAEPADEPSEDRA